MAAQQESRQRALIIGDWDADGVIASAEIVYAQEVLGLFPAKCKCPIELAPASPRTLQSVLEGYRGSCWCCLVLLDIPFTNDVESALEAFMSAQQSLGCKPRLYYFDHHKTTLESATKIEEKYSGLVFVGVSPTSVLVKAFLESMGAKLTPRLRDLVSGAAVLEGGGWLSRAVRGVSDGIVKMTASISKVLNQTKDPELWRRYVKWAASVLPFEPTPLAHSNPLEEGMSISEESDREIRQVAVDLAMSAKPVGFLKFVDARGKWSKGGSSALASAIYKMVKCTVALLVSKQDGTNLLIIRSSHGEAMSIAEELLKAGIAADIGGHHNIASLRLKEEVTVQQLEDALRRASLEAARKVKE